MKRGVSGIDGAASNDLFSGQTWLALDVVSARHRRALAHFGDLECISRRKF
jgi:hypothetical protein